MKKCAWFWASAVVLLVCCGSVVTVLADDADTQPEKPPPPLTHYKGREIAATMHYTGAPWLTRESRDREEDSKTMLKMLRLKPGMVVCDLGAGNGFYTLPIAQAVGKEGAVYAVEIQVQMLHFLKRRAERAGIENIEYVLGELHDPKLPEGKMDMVLLVDVYHEFSHPEHMLKAIHRSLKPEGVMVLLEFRAEDPKVPILPLHKMSKKQIMAEVPPNGFALVEEFDELPWQHMMYFKRDDAPSVREKREQQEQESKTQQEPAQGQKPKQRD